MITNDPGHREGFSYLGLHRYSLTFRTNERRPLFTDGAVVDTVVRQLVRTASEQQFSIIAYCFMPDHLHLLVEGTTADSDGKRFITLFKQYSDYDYSCERQGPLWQRYGFEHVLGDDETTLEVVRYILRNPVRAGLASTVEEYPYVASLR
jgi:putative transposase